MNAEHIAMPLLIGGIVFHPDHEHPAAVLETISYLRQGLEFLELRYQSLVRKAPEPEPAPPPRKQARKQASGQGKVGRPKKQAANGAAPPAEPPLFPPPESPAEDPSHAA